MILSLTIYAFARYGLFGNNVIDLNDSEKKKYLGVTQYNFFLFSWATYWKDPNSKVPCYKNNIFLIRPTYIYHNGILQKESWFGLKNREHRKHY